MSIADPGAWLVWLVVLPLAAAIAVFLVPRIAFGIACVNGLFTAALALAVLDRVTEGPVRYAIGGWGAPLGIDLYADPLSGIMLVGASLVLLATTFYAPGYLAHARINALYWPLVLILQLHLWK